MQLHASGLLRPVVLHPHPRFICGPEAAADDAAYQRFRLDQKTSEPDVVPFRIELHSENCLVEFQPAKRGMFPGVLGVRLDVELGIDESDVVVIPESSCSVYVGQLQAQRAGKACFFAELFLGIHTGREAEFIVAADGAPAVSHLDGTGSEREAYSPCSGRDGQHATRLLAISSLGT